LEELLPADDLRIAALARGYAGLLGEQSNWLESLKRRLQANRIIGAYKARQAPAGGEDAKT
jgi:hypothetical protein